MSQMSIFDPPMVAPIERGIAIPDGRVRHKRIEWAAIRKILDSSLAQMQIGDSIAIRGEWIPSADLMRIQNYVSGAACTYRADQSPGTWAFTTRQMPDHSVRLWRIDPAEAKGRGED